MTQGTDSSPGSTLPAANTRSRWWLVAGLLITAFLARAPLYLAVFPPFEGWDEYQHLAFIAHLDETGTAPAYDDRVPLSLRPLLMAMPHSESGAEQMREWSALTYAAFWSASPPEPAAGAAAPRLYQSQQPPLAYVLALPIWRGFEAQPLTAIAAIRMANLLLVAAALVLFAAALTRLVPSFAPRVAVLALVCLHPLFFQNAARVANDGLAVATGLAAMSLLVLADGRTLLSRGVLAAACLAASVWSKQTSLTLVPVLLAAPAAEGWAHAVPLRRLIRTVAITAAAFLGLVAPAWVANYQQYGAVLTTQDSVELAARGSVASALAASATSLDWWSTIDFLFVPARVWVGGWSFLPVHAALDGLYRWLWGVMLVAAVAGAIVALRGRRWQLDRRDSARLTVCAAVVACTVLGMAYHAVLSNAVFGRVMTTPWYFMTALPFLFVLVVRGLESIHPRAAIVACTALAALFVAVDLHGTWVQMPAAYASTTVEHLQWSRLSSIHPAMLSGDRRWWFLGLQLGALALAGGMLARESTRRV